MSGFFFIGSPFLHIEASHVYKDGCRAPTNLPIKKVQPGGSQKECFGTDKDGPGFLPLAEARSAGFLYQNRAPRIPSLLHITGKQGDIMAPKPFVITVVFAHALHDVGHYTSL